MAHTDDDRAPTVTPAADTTRAPPVLDPGPHWTSHTKALAWTIGLAVAMSPLMLFMFPVDCMEGRPLWQWECARDAYREMVRIQEDYRRDMRRIDGLLDEPHRAPPGRRRRERPGSL